MSGSAGRPERGPLAALDGLGSTPWPPWPPPIVVETTASTMSDAQRLADEGAPEGTVVVAEEQTAGRGRRGRTWESAPRAGLWWSVILRPDVPAWRLGWLPLVVGVGVADAIHAVSGAEARLKWPNDVLIDARKVAGVLSERLSDGAVVVGVGINVHHDPSELPDGAASLASLGSAVDRTSLLVAVLGSVAASYRSWAAGTDFLPDYAGLSATLGCEVSVDLGDRLIGGTAIGLGPSGELVVRDAAGVEHVLSAGDVTLLRAGT